ncbi:MAG: SAM-dependent methyltransferase [Burkholderiales bacterium]|jgi:predicted O-methyltransferase YrrM|nr:SAM-dependent methyltransferase [Burkholderiales bacterium]
MKGRITEELYRYALSIAKDEHPVLQDLRKRTQTLPGSHMQISPDQGQFMAMLAKILGAHKYLEIGVFTGYSALAVTLAMNADSAMTFALDNDQVTMEVAKEYWAKACVVNKITPIIGEALTSLIKLIENGHSNTFDMVFIDARKSDYIAYFERSYQLIKPGGIILIDNIFMQGLVLEHQQKESARAVDEFNHFLKSQDLDYCVTTIADGLTIVRKPHQGGI